MSSEIEASISLYAEYQRGSIVLRGYERNGKVSSVRLRPAKRMLRVAAKSSDSALHVATQIATTLGVPVSRVSLKKETGRPSLPHELNCPLQRHPMTLYVCFVKLTEGGLRPVTVKANSSVCFIDFTRNAEPESQSTATDLWDRECLAVELELLGIAVPCRFTLQDYNPETCALCDMITVHGPLLPNETMQCLGVAYIANTLDDNRGSILHGVSSGKSSQLAKERCNFKVVSGHSMKSPEEAVFGIVLVPARDYSHFHQKSLHNGFKVFESEAVVCYEALLARLYGTQYRRQIPEADCPFPSPETIRSVAAMAVNAGFYASAPLEDAFCGSQIRIAWRLAQKAYRRADYLPPPRYPRNQSTQKQASYQGGAILQAEIGLHVQNTVLVDFNSHYPSVIAEYSLFPAPVGPDATGREGPEAEIANLVAKKRKETDPIARKGLKLALVCYYGAQGSQHSPLYCRSVAGAITSKGRRLLETVKENLSELGAKNLFGHTDSVASQLPDCQYPDFCDNFNAKHEVVKLEVEHKFSCCWVINRTTYIALVNTADTSALDSFYDTFQAQAQKLLPTQCEKQTFEGILQYTEARLNCSRALSAMLSEAKKCLTFPGLISGIRPRAMNALVVLLACLSVDVMQDEDRTERSRQVLDSFLSLMDLENSNIPPCQVPAWTHEFPLSDPSKAKLGRSCNAALSNDAWNELQLLRDTGVPERNFLAKYLFIHSLELPEQPAQIVNIASSGFKVNKLIWLATIYRKWNNYVCDLRSTGSSIAAKRIETLLSPLRDLCANVKIRGYRMSRPPLKRQTAGLALETQIIPIPSGIDDVRLIVKQWVHSSGGCEAKSDADAQMKTIRDYIQTLLVGGDGKSNVHYSISLLLERLDATEALRMSASSARELEQRLSDRAFQSHETFYQDVLKLAATAVM